MSDAPSSVDILLVDDDPHNLGALDAVLEAEDCNLVHAASGEEALRYLLTRDVAVILMDVHMPLLDGFETAALIRGQARSADTPIIFLTAAVTGHLARSRGYSLGAVDYITKPFDPDVLRSKIAVFVELFKKTAQVEQQARQLGETTVFLNSILESSTGYAIMALDLQGRFLAWNAGARRMYGYSADEMVGKQSVKLLHTPEDVGSGRVADVLQLALRSGKVEGTFQQVRRNGERFSASVVLDHRMDAEGTTIGFVAIAQDITERLRAEEERARLIEERAARAEAEASWHRIQEINAVLRETIVSRDLALKQAQEAMQTRDEFLAAASHDLRTPLTVIRAQAQLLARRASRSGRGDEDGMVSALNRITVSTRKISRLIDQMLDVAQLQVGRPLQLDRGPTDIVALAGEVVAELAETERGPRIRLETTEPSLVGLWDAARVERVIGNLVHNALKYSPDGGEILVHLARSDGTHEPPAVVLRVQDAGVGIPADELPRVFDRFFRGRNVVGKIYGTGIGLAGVRQIVEQHGGSIAVVSTEGQGTVVTVRLPLEPPPTTAPDSGEAAGGAPDALPLRATSR